MLWHTCSFADFTYSRPPRIIACSFFSFPFFSTAPLPLAPALVSRQFLSLPFHRSNEDFRRMAKTPLPSPGGGRILRFKSLESRLKTSHPNFPPTFNIRDSFVNSPARVVRESPYEMETLPSSNVQRDVRPFCSKENTCALVACVAWVNRSFAQIVYQSRGFFSSRNQRVSSKSVHRWSCFLEKREERENTLLPSPLWLR